MECAADLGHGLACKGQHEEMVEIHNMIVDRSARMVSRGPKGSFLMPAFFIFMGLGFCGATLFGGRGIASWDFMMGAGFLVFGAILFLYTRFYNRKVFGDRKNV